MTAGGTVRARPAELLKNGRFPHAAVLESADGGAAFALAKDIARTLVCARGTGCGVCAECVLAASGNHPDLSVYAPEKGVFPVALARRVIADAGIKPARAERKVLILRDADRMTEEAQNALLKTLEDPPGSAHFLLLAGSAAALRETVRSRCAVYTLPPEERENPPGCAWDFERLFALAAADKTMELAAELAALGKDRQNLAAFLDAFAEAAARKLRVAAVARDEREMSVFAAAREAVLSAGGVVRANGNIPLQMTLLCERLIAAARR